MERCIPANTFDNIPFLKDLYLTITKSDNTKKFNKNQQSHLKHLLKILTVFFKKHDISYYLFGGTLLGVYRENGIIKYDDDLDFVIGYKNIDKVFKNISELNDQHVKLVNWTWHPPFINTPKLQYKSATADLFLLDENNKLNPGLVIDIGFQAKYLNKTLLNDTGYMTFWKYKGMIRKKIYVGTKYECEVCIPENTEELLEIWYGKSWNVPIWTHGGH